MLLCPMLRLEFQRPPPTSVTRDARDSLIMDPGCKEAEMVPGKDDGFRENGAVEWAGENDTLIANQLSPDPEASGMFGFSFLDQNRDKI